MALDQNNKTAEDPANRQPTGFLAWLKRWSRFRQASRHRLEELRIKREISRLEKARLKEKTALNEQRRFYERVFKRLNSKPDRPHYEHPPAPLKPKPVIASAPLPVTPPLPPTPVPPPPPPVVREEKEQPAMLPASPERAVSSFSEMPAPVPPKPEPKAPARPRPSALSHLLGRSLVKKLAKERAEEEAWQDKNEVEKRFWQPYQGVKPNLIKDQGVVFFNWQEHLLILALSLVMCCLVIALVYVGLLIWHQERLENNRATIANFKVINDEIVKSETELQEVLTFNNKLSLVSSLINNHVHWTNFLFLLEETTLKDVYYDKFAGDLSGVYTIPAQSRSLEAVSLQLDVMKAYENVKSVSYDTGANQGATQTVKFNLGISVDPKVFIK